MCGVQAKPVQSSVDGAELLQFDSNDPANTTQDIVTPMYIVTLLSLSTVSNSAA